MQCSICHNAENNESFELREMMYGFRDRFTYFKCTACGCIQIAHAPADIGKYYPGDYYSYAGGEKIKKASLFTILQCQSIIRDKRSWWVKLITYKYKAPEWYELLKRLKIFNRSSPVLDIGSGSGGLLKFFYKAGYKDLTGIDPYLQKDIIYNKQLRVEKKTIFEVNRQYEAIMLNHSLEHMDDQAEVIKKLYSLLAENGRLLIRIPVVSEPLMEKYGSHVVSLDPPRHFFIHSFKSISLLLENAGFEMEHVVYDAHEFSFWGSEQYQHNISLHNDPESYLVKKTFSDLQMAKWEKQIEELNKAGQSDNIAIYLKKKTRP